MSLFQFLCHSVFFCLFVLSQYKKSVALVVVHTFCCCFCSSGLYLQNRGGARFCVIDFQGSYVQVFLVGLENTQENIEKKVLKASVMQRRH